MLSIPTLALKAGIALHGGKSLRDLTRQSIGGTEEWTFTEGSATVEADDQLVGGFLPNR
jgi:hypothetical protein